jgi:FlaA1/EpsC-like NDP-sugar epimerase
MSIIHLVIHLNLQSKQVYIYIYIYRLLLFMSHVINLHTCSYIRNNVMGTHVLLEAAKIRKIQRFIHVSTDEVYGEVINGVS